MPLTAGNSSGINDGAAGVDPMIMGMGPVEAMRSAVTRAGLTLGDLDVIELNEAFASQSLAVGREFGLDAKKVKVHGGGRGAASLCIGGGMGTAMVVEVA